MAPEAHLTSDNQSKEVLNWVLAQKSRVVQMATEVEVNGALAHKDRKPMIAIVNNEPLVIFEDIFSGKVMLSCSDNHAKELAKKGIVPFPPQSSEEGKVAELIKLVSQPKLISDDHK